MTTPVGGSSGNQPIQPSDTPQPTGLPSGYSQITNFFGLQSLPPQEQIQFVTNWIQQTFGEPLQKEMQYQQALYQAQQQFYSGGDWDPPMRP